MVTLIHYSVATRPSKVHKEKKKKNSTQAE
jgi:hypothetical protein